MIVNQPKEKDLRVWWIPQVPENNPFYVPVKDVDQAKFLIRTLADYDVYQFEHRVKPDYSNAGGLEVFMDGEWSDWVDEDDYSIDDIMEMEDEEERNGA